MEIKETKTASPKKHILLVDDDPLMRRLFGGKLVDEGFEVIYANNGNEGRETARRLHPDLILLDYMMPVMDGMEAAKRMKEEKETADIPIIMLTNADLSLEAQKVLKELWVKAYVHKSADFTILMKHIHEVLGAAQ